ncbi:hypothetical protein Vadar_023788 [Vaccinium darrowii]|uniref:Uncharacterized protein n=1 Tax=Vaccinium darrowii TaxID=229202 RepID=A0ACB7YZP6_9ERIC|nr:hypothetical protein Vadar_023788 [Vaccinium darrowii]
MYGLMSTPYVIYMKFITPLGIEAPLNRFSEARAVKHIRVLSKDIDGRQVTPILLLYTCFSGHALHYGSNGHFELNLTFSGHALHYGSNHVAVTVGGSNGHFELNVYKLMIANSVLHVLPSLRENHDEFLLRELVKRWANHKIMVRFDEDAMECYIGDQ